MIQLIVEELRSSTEQVSSLTIGQTPSNHPVGDSTNESIQHVLDQNIDSVLGPEQIFMKYNSSN